METFSFTKKSPRENAGFSQNFARRSAAGSFFQLRRWFETQTLRRLDLDRLARLRIAAHTRAAFRNAKRAEGPDLIRAAVALCRFEPGLDRIEHKFNVTLGLGHCDIALLRYVLDEIRLAHFAIPSPSEKRSRYSAII